jgi:hypothetical protein
MQATSQDAQEILDRVRQKQVERMAGVDCYLVDQTAMGERTLALYERVAADAGGDALVAFRMVPPAEMQRRQSGGQLALTPGELEAFAEATERTGQVLGSEVERGMQEAGLPGALLGAMGAGAAGEPWASPDPRVMLGSSAPFLRGAAAAGRHKDQGGSSPGAIDLAKRARVVGTETVDAREAFHLRADALNHTQRIEGGGEFTMDTADFWIDKKMYVPLKFTLQGTMKAQGQARPLMIEKSDRNYQPVPGSKMYQSRERLMRLSGVMSPEEQAQLKEAKTQMAQLEQQLATMPKAQQEMMKSMMGPQMAMIRNMAGSGGFEMATRVNAIRIIDCR